MSNTVWLSISKSNTEHRSHRFGLDRQIVQNVYVL